MDDAIWLLEFLARTQGAPHLKISSVHLNLAQYYSLDTSIIIGICLLSSLYIFLRLLSTLFSHLWNLNIASKESQEPTKSKFKVL